MGEKAPNRHIILMRLNMFYKLNPVALRKLMMYSEKVLDFNKACDLIISLLKTIYSTIKKKEECLNDTDKENNIPAKRRKTNDDSGNMNYFVSNLI